MLRTVSADSAVSSREALLPEVLVKDNLPVLIKVARHRLADGRPLESLHLILPKG